MVGERPKPFGEALGFDPITSTLIFGEHDAVLVDAMMTVAEAEALADWVALHNRNLEDVYKRQRLPWPLVLSCRRIGASSFRTSMRAVRPRQRACSRGIL